MISIDDAVNFFNAYSDIEHAGITATYSEPDEVVNEYRTGSMRFWHAEPGTPLSPSFGRPMGMGSDQLAQLARNVSLVRRTLFLVAEYRGRDGGSVYAGIVSGDRTRTAESYGGLLYATEVDGDLRIVASYKEDFGKVSPPVHWRHSQGMDIGLPGPPVAVRPLAAPTGQAAHLKDWEGLRDSVAER
ncbi:hypothetical protein ACPEIF_07495 [Streptomyces sp. NPDC012600]|uniref:SnoaL-like domain-containing protein n=1 Tax=Kitasatospora albolonga TaxID=68173 RepID=A0ABC8BV44_9ACTN|nr:hypothetical protein B7C62_18050 [Kitasatospora albolonga]